jgi:hypothetical protein
LGSFIYDVQHLVGGGGLKFVTVIVFQTKGFCYKG